MKDQEDALPYWPSQAFLNESMKLLREKGVNDSDEELLDQIHQAYWKKRAEILADKAMEKYED